MTHRGVKRGKRHTIWLRDSGACHYCRIVTDQASGTVDHIWPHSRGGVKANWNLVWSCSPCNLEWMDSVAKCWCQTCHDARALHGHFADETNPSQQVSELHDAWRRVRPVS